MIRINQLKITPEVSLSAGQLDTALKGKISKALRLKGDNFSYKIVKKSIDSRHKPDIFIVYSDRKSTRLNSSHQPQSRMPSSA